MVPPWCNSTTENTLYHINEKKFRKEKYTSSAPTPTVRHPHSKTNGPCA